MSVSPRWQDVLRMLSKVKPVLAARLQGVKVATDAEDEVVIVPPAAEAASLQRELHADSALLEELIAQVYRENKRVVLAPPDAGVRAGVPASESVGGPPPADAARDESLRRALSVGQDLARNRQWARAIPNLQKVVDLDPTNVRARLLLADCHLKLERPQDAHGTLLSGAELCLQQGRLEEAEALAGRASREGSVQGTLLLGLVAMDRGSLRDGEQLFAEILTKAPGHPAAQLNLARCHARQGRLPKAIELYADLVRRNPGDMDAMQELAESHAKSGQKPQAADHFARVASFYARQFHLDRAAAYARMALAQSSGHVEARNQLIAALHYQGRKDELLDEYRALRTTYEEKGAADEIARVDKKIADLERQLASRPAPGDRRGAAAPPRPAAFEASDAPASAPPPASLEAGRRPMRIVAAGSGAAIVLGGPAVEAPIVPSAPEPPREDAASAPERSASTPPVSPSGMETEESKGEVLLAPASIRQPTDEPTAPQPADASADELLGAFAAVPIEKLPEAAPVLEPPATELAVRPAADEGPVAPPEAAIPGAFPLAERSVSAPLDPAPPAAVRDEPPLQPPPSALPDMPAAPTLTPELATGAVWRSPGDESSVDEMLTDFARLFRETKRLRRLREIDEIKTATVGTIAEEVRRLLVWSKALFSAESDRMEQLPAETQELFYQIAAKNPLLERLLQDLLEFTELVDEEYEMPVETGDLTLIAQEALEYVRPLATVKRVELRFEAPPSPYILPFHGGRVTEVLRQLLQNSVKFTPQGGTVGLEIRDLPSTAELVVTDSGRPVHADPGSVFIRFRGISDSLSSKIKGRGIRMPIVQSIIEAHGGRFLIEGIEGVGNRFTFTLPKVPANARDHDDDVMPHSSGPG